MDNGALLEGLREGAGAFRGVVMVDELVEDETLRELHDAGVRAIRTQLTPHSDKPISLDVLRKLAERVAPLGWHVEIHVNVSVTPDIDVACTDFPTPVLIEHMGHVPPDVGVDNPGFQALLRMIRNGGWVMLSGPYLHSKLPPPHDDVRPFLEALVEAAPERAVYGSNWPHPHREPTPDEWSFADAVVRWIGDESVLQQVLVDNPTTLYDFPAVPQSIKRG
jgi:predicted TIM-barrel fold metal-dependent hydrolase